MSSNQLRLRANAVLDLASMGRKGCLVAGQVIAGAFSFDHLFSSDQFGDLWRVREAILFGVGPPTESDRHIDGKYAFHFIALNSHRKITEGEEFTQVEASLTNQEAFQQT